MSSEASSSSTSRPPKPARSSSSASATASPDTVSETDPAERLLITSTGPSCEYWGEVLGEYLLDKTSSTTYRQRHDYDSDMCYYLYRHKDGEWRISRTLGGSFRLLYNPSKTPRLPLSGWRCATYDGSWVDDPLLSISTEIPPPCREIHIAGTGQSPEKCHSTWGPSLPQDDIAVAVLFTRTTRGNIFM